jgi:hypothetical protein
MQGDTLFAVSVRSRNSKKGIMNSFSTYNTPSNERTTDGIRPVAIVSQLLQSIAEMQNIDELFTWIATMMVQRGMKLAQVWAAQANTGGALRIKLRASSSQHHFQIQQVSENAEVRALIERMIRGQQGILSIPVTNIFSPYQATLLAQQNCQYWTVYFLSKNVLLPPMPRESRQDDIPTPMQMAFSFFTQQPLQPSHARAISFLVEQSLRIALNQGLFSPVTRQQTGSLPGISEGNTLPALALLIPEHTQNTAIEQAENPFSSAVVITEKKVRQMYNLIDGKKNVVELASLVQMNPKEMLEALQSFLVQGYIKLRDTQGHLVDNSAFFQAF